MASNDTPAHKQVLRFHLQFTSLPPLDRTPHSVSAKYILSLIRAPVPSSSTESVTEPQSPQNRQTQTQNLHLAGQADPDRSADFEDQEDYEARGSSLDSHRTNATLSHTVSTTVSSVGHALSSGSKAAFYKMKAKVPSKQPDTSTSLASLAPEIGRPGLYNLNGFLPVTNLTDLAEWEARCEILPALEPRELLRDMQARSIHILRSKLRVTPPQFFSAVEMLSKGSIFLAHEMGIGKTHTVLAALPLRILVFNSKNACAQAWGSRSNTKHLPKLARYGVCPSQSERYGDVQCYCVPTGITRQLGDSLSHGVALVQFPANAKAEWMNAADQAEFTEKSYDFVVVSSSTDVPLRLRGDLEMYKRRFKLKMTPRPDNDKRKSASYHPESVEWTVGARNADLDSTVFFITAGVTASWHKTFQHPIRFSDQENTVYGAPVGLSVIDEAHTASLWGQASGPTTQTYSMAR